MDITFNLQLFGGGKGGSTTVNSYEPSEYELQLQKMQAEYANAVAPNAKYLNDTARKVLEDSLGTVQVDFNAMNQTAQDQIADSTAALKDLTGENTAAANAVNAKLAGYEGRYEPLAQNNVDAANKTNAALADIMGQYGRLMGQNNNATNSANADISKQGANVEALQRGELPSPYLQNMSDAIRTGIANTVGANINDLSKRGVLNSSVTNKALNDVESNVSDTMAKSFLANINTLGDLADKQVGYTGQKLSNSTNNTGLMANLLGQQAGLANQQFANVRNVNDANAGYLGQQTGLAQQQYQNTMGANAQNEGIYNNLINTAGQPIAIAAAAQEAAQTPALNLWNASMGLNSTTTGALAAAAGKGTTTSTTSSNGPGFLGSLLGGAAMGLASGYTGGLGSLWACFPAGTRVKMGDGHLQNIETIKEGDTVMTASGEPAEVVSLMEPKKNVVYTIITHNGLLVRTTSTQEIMDADGKWIFVEDIEPGATLMGAGEVVSKRRDGSQTVYDLHVGGDNTYIADGVIVKGGDW